MSNKISVIIDVTVDRANQAIGNFRKSISDADGAVGKFKAGAASAFASLKANALPASAAAGAAMYKLGQESVEAASALEQAIGAVEKSFGDASDEVLAFAEDAADSVGLSTRAYAEAAVRLGSFAKQIANDTGRPVAEVLNDLIVRSSDLAATFGVDVSEAISKVASGLAGESEPLRAWGIDMRKTAIQANAAATGIDDMGEATQAAGLLFKSSSDYAGQFADESETLAGQQQRLGAELENMLAALGEQLIPIITEATASIRDLMSVTGQANQATGGLAGKFVDLAQANYKYLNPVGQARTALDFLTGSSDEAAESTAGLGQSMVQASVDAALLNQRTEDLAAAQEDAKNAYIDHAKGMQRESRRTTDELIADMQRLRGEMSDRTAYLDVEEAFASMQEAGVQAFDGTEQSARDFERAQIAASEATLDYIDDLAGVPPEVKSEIAALIDEGAFEEVERRLASLERVRTTRIAVQNAGPSSYVPPATVSGYRASGGPVNAGGAYVVGEDGPELLQMGSQSGNVIPNGATVGGGGINIGTVVLPNVKTPEDFVRDLRTYVKRNGPIQGIT